MQRARHKSFSFVEIFGEGLCSGMDNTPLIISLILLIVSSRVNDCQAVAFLIDSGTIRFWHDTDSQIFLHSAQAKNEYDPYLQRLHSVLFLFLSIYQSLDLFLLTCLQLSQSLFTSLFQPRSTLLNLSLHRIVSFSWFFNLQKN